MIPEGQAGSRESSAPKCIDARYVSSLAPFRPVDGHKGTFGTLLIRAGSPGMGGAAVMCCEAGLRSGTGLVRLYSDRAMAGPILGSCPQALFTPLPDSAEETITVLDRLTADSDAVVFGPGIPPDSNTAEEEAKILIAKAQNLLMDAGAVTVLANRRESLFRLFSERRKAELSYPVLTPHPGEFSRLVPEWDKYDRVRIPARFAEEHKVILVLKGHETAVFTPAGLWYINTVGNDGLAKGGSGDVLAGLIGGFMAQGIHPEAAAVCGVFFHGLSGDIISGRLGRRYMQPTDLFDGFPEAFRTCGWQ
ncbi:MAG: NAD(P)H-hydrate dehydratase [Clostridiaceae bacterium]|jgi:NAD(P)H-hydrate epimerase|nr:NAD(P)H-hydrate dehydratase [Clostridiaceae bacterium]